MTANAANWAGQGERLCDVMMTKERREQDGFFGKVAPHSYKINMKAIQALVWLAALLCASPDREQK